MCRNILVRAFLILFTIIVNFSFISRGICRNFRMTVNLWSGWGCCRPHSFLLVPLPFPKSVEKTSNMKQKFFSILLKLRRPYKISPQVHCCLYLLVRTCWYVWRKGYENQMPLPTLWCRYSALINFSFMVTTQNSNFML